MHPPVKDQTMIGHDEPTIDTTDLDDMTRQEFKDETDITKILYRYGVPNRVNPTFGDYDYTLDLQAAMGALTEANEAVSRLPAALREKYGTISALQDGILTGDFQKDYEAHRTARRIEQEDADYAARTAAYDRALKRRQEAEDREAFEEFRKKNKNVKPTEPIPEDFP